MSAHRDLQELLPLYALGALEGTPDCERVCAHLATGCATCAELLADHARTAGDLATSLPPQTPRPEMRAALATRLASTRPAADGESARPASPRAVALPRVRAWRSAFALAAAVAAVGILAAFKFQDDYRREHTRLAENARRLEQTRRDQERLAAQLVDDQRVIAAIRAGHAQLIPLSAAKDQQGEGAIVWDRANDRWILIARGMKPLPAGKAYELWFIAKDGRKVAAGTFRPDAAGNARHERDVPPQLGPAIALGAVTLEPAAGVEAPTGPIVLSGKAG